MTIEKQVDELSKRIHKLEKAAVLGKNPAMSPAFVKRVVEAEYKRQESKEGNRFKSIETTMAKWTKMMETMGDQLALAKVAKNTSRADVAIGVIENRMRENELKQQGIANWMDEFSKKLDLRKIEILKAEMVELKKTKETLLQRVAELQKTQAEHAKSVESHRNRADQAAVTNAGYIELSNAVKQERADQASLQKRIDALEAELKKSKAALEASQAEAKAAMQLATGMSAAFNNTIAGLSKQIADLRKLVEAKK